MGERSESGLLSTHWSLGTLILVGLATSEYAGAASIVALPMIAVSTCLGALSAPPPPRPTDTLPKKRKCSDIVEYLEIWLNILEHLAAGATCARVASTTMDYMSRGRLRDWLFGLESHSLGEAWPDVLGVTIVVVTTALFMLGLDRSPSLSILLYLGLGASFLFFILIGSFHTDTIFWNWTEDFKLNNWGCILTTAAMCAYGFPNTISRGTQTRKPCLKYGISMILPLFSYLSIVVVFTFMSHFRELAGTAIPLVRVFEVRDVDWARPIMATCTIFVSCIALTEIVPSLYGCIIRLASREWRMLVSSLLYRNPATGAPVLAIFTVGSLTSILAFACPLSYLVRLLNVSPLLKCVLRTSRSLYAKYRAEFPHEELISVPFSVQHSNVQYSRLQKGSKKHARSSPTRRIKTAFDMMPRFLRSTSFGAAKGFTSTTMEDKEYLLMDDYSQQGSRGHHADDETDTDSEVGEISSMCMEVEGDSSSSTDIDAVVQEYKEQVQVSTVNGFGDDKRPTRTTSRVVMAALLLMYLTSTLIAAGILMNVFYLAWTSTIVTLFCILVVLLMPQNLQTGEDLLPKRILPIVSLAATAFNVILATSLLVEVWFGVIVWICGGLILFCRCECCTCEGLYPTSKERLRLQGPKIDCGDHIDAVLITR